MCFGGDTGFGFQFRFRSRLKIRFRFGFGFGLRFGILPCAFPLIFILGQFPGGVGRRGKEGEWSIPFNFNLVCCSTPLLKAMHVHL